jgi:hypothetical protein
MSAHGLNHGWIRRIQVDQDVAGILTAGIGTNVDVMALAIGQAQEFNAGEIQHLWGRPKPLAGPRPTRGVVDQTKFVALAGHCRELAPHGPNGKRKSVIDHAAC